MPRLQRRSFANAEEVRRFPNGELRLVTFDDIVFGNFLFQPGWRWSNDVRPIAGTAQCEHRHIGFVVSGRLHIQMNDGATMDFVPARIFASSRADITRSRASRASARCSGLFDLPGKPS